MNNTRKIIKVSKSRPTMEGAGVHLNRAFGYEDPSLDPFLLLDEFHSNNPDDYMEGFPWHPHRGFETITYVIHGRIEHSDSLGNKGVINAGDVQWMSAGNGIIHQEMPKQDNGPLLWGLQLWANLPSSQKMLDPQYRGITKEQIPKIELNNNQIKIKIISGEINGVKGPVKGVITDPVYLDVSISPESEFKHSIPNGHNVFAYILEGEGYFDETKTQLINKGHLIVFGPGDQVVISTKNEPVRFLLIAGKPIREPVAWQGSIVMNTNEEIRKTYDELRRNTFIKHKAKV
jgi:redox-sensitive bicupin YhaK (pirin superfamily)